MLRESTTSGKILRTALAAALAGMMFPAVALVAPRQAYASDGTDPTNASIEERVSAASGLSAPVSDLADSGYTIRLKTVLAQGDELPRKCTLDRLFESHADAFLAQYVDFETLYDPGDGSDFYIADLGAAKVNGSADRLLDAQFTEGADETAPNVLDSIGFDADSGLAYVPKSLFGDGEGGYGAGALLTAQVLAAGDVSRDSVGIDVGIDNPDQGAAATAVARSQTIEADPLTSWVTVPVATPDTASNLSLGDIEMRVNGASEPMRLVGASESEDAANAAYDPGSGELTVALNPATTTSISISLPQRGVIESILSPTSAYASAATDAADDFTYLMSKDKNGNGKRYKVSFDKMTVQEVKEKLSKNGALTYTYAGSVKYKNSAKVSDGAAVESMLWSQRYWIGDVGADGTYSKIDKAEGWSDVYNSAISQGSWPVTSNTPLFGISLPCDSSASGDARYVATSTKSSGKVKLNFHMKGALATENSASYKAGHMLAASCAHVSKPAVDSDGEKNCYVKVLRADTADNYIVIGVLSGETNTQCGYGMYKVYVPDASAELTSIRVKKESADPGATEGNDSYSLEGAKFGLYEDKADAAQGDPSQALATAKTKADGTCTFEKVEAGANYYVRELEAPKGYTLKTTPLKVATKGKTAKDTVEAVFPESAGMAKISVLKKNGSPDVTSVNPGQYSLEGTEFTVYSDEQCTQKVTSMTAPAGCGDSFTLTSESLPLGTYYVRETKWGKGFYSTASTAVKTYTVTLSEDGRTYAVNGGEAVYNYVTNDPLHIAKLDAETGSSSPQGGASLALAEVRIDYYATDPVANPTAASVRGMEPAASFTVRLDGGGEFYFEDAEKPFVYEGASYARLVSSSYGGKQDAAPMITAAFRGSMGTPAIPAGIVAVREVKAPKGYGIDTETYYRSVSHDSESEVTVSVSDPVQRADLKLAKVDDSSSPSPIAGVPFRLTNTDTGEKHVVVTDASGKIDTSANRKAASSNANDGYSLLAEVAAAATGKTTLDASAGVWFGKTADGKAASAPADGKGGLQYGHYRLEELWAPSNLGRQLVSCEFEVGSSAAELTYTDQGTIVDKTLRISTTASDALDGDKDVVRDGSAEVTDAVVLENLTKGATYRLEGTLVDKRTGAVLKQQDGGEVTAASGEFAVTDDASAARTEKTLTFSFDASDMREDTDLVAFERLYLVSWDGAATGLTEPVASHEDLSDEGQTVTVRNPVVRTTASVDGEKSMAPEGSQALDDQVEASGLLPSTDYTCTITAMDKSTGKAAAAPDAGAADGGEADVAGSAEASGQPATATADFRTDADGNASLSMSVLVDAGSLEPGATLVAFEAISRDGKQVAEHEDIDDAGQSVAVMVPAIETTATDATDGDAELLASTKSEVVDTISYEGLLPGARYTAKGHLVDKATGEKVEGSEGSVDFTADSLTGTVDVSLQLDTSDMGSGTELVAFENVYREGQDEPVASHEDLESEEQTVTVETAQPASGDPEGGKLLKTGSDTLASALAASALAVGGAALIALGARRRKTGPGLPESAGTGSADWWNDMR